MPGQSSTPQSSSLKPVLPPFVPHQGELIALVFSLTVTDIFVKPTGPATCKMTFNETDHCDKVRKSIVNVFYLIINVVFVAVIYLVK